MVANVTTPHHTQVKKDLDQDQKCYHPAPPKLNFAKGVEIKDCDNLHKSIMW